MRTALDILRAYWKYIFDWTTRSENSAELSPIHVENLTTHARFEHFSKEFRYKFNDNLSLEELISNSKTKINYMLSKLYASVFSLDDKNKQ